MNTDTQPYPMMLRLTHVGLIIFGLSSYLTGELAEEAERGLTTGYWIHAYLGLTLLVILLGRIVYGFTKPDWSMARWFSGDTPFVSAIKQDLGTLIRLQLPDRDDHNGLAGLVQTFGLLIFFWMGVTGAVLFVMGGPETSRLAHVVAEAHEVGELLIPLFLALHIGAVVMHTLSGHAILQRMNPFTKQASPE